MASVPSASRTELPLASLPASLPASEPLSRLRADDAASGRLDDDGDPLPARYILHRCQPGHITFIHISQPIHIILHPAKRRGDRPSGPIRNLADEGTMERRARPGVLACREPRRGSRVVCVLWQAISAMGIPWELTPLICRECGSTGGK